MHLSRLDMSRHRVGEVTKFSNVGGSSDVNTLRVIIERGICGCQGGWEAAVHGWVDEFGALTKEDLPKMVEAETSLFHDIRYRHCLEIATMVDFTRFPVHERVVRSCKWV